MSKIIKIENDMILIGNDDGTISEVHSYDCNNFKPKVGDVVEVYKNENKTIVIKNNNSHNANTLPPHTVNKLAYCLFALFLGGLGVHKFYANKIGSGLLYLIFFWTAIPAIIGFIEAIISLCKPADANGNIIV